VLEAMNAFIVGMGEMGLTPLEGLLAGELALWTLIENGLKLSNEPAMLAASKAQAVRLLNRLVSRLEAWPAKTSERM